MPEGHTFPETPCWRGARDRSRRRRSRRVTPTWGRDGGTERGPRGLRLWHEKAFFESHYTLRRRPLGPHYPCCCVPHVGELFRAATPMASRLSYLANMGFREAYALRASSLAKPREGRPRPSYHHVPTLPSPTHRPHPSLRKKI
jgi:hypothetical protein